MPRSPEMTRLRRVAGSVARRLGLLPSRGALPPVPTGDLGDGPVAGIELLACTLLFSYLRVRGLVTLAAGADASSFRARLEQDGGLPLQGRQVLARHSERALEFVVEALADRARPAEAIVLVIDCGGAESRFTLGALQPQALARDLRSLMPQFQAALQAHQGGRARLLDIGGRARSNVQRSEMFPECEVTVLDIVAADGVDVVADAHQMSRALPAEHFDFVFSASVFEHLLMPWKVAVEMNRVMRPGGVALVHTHQTIGMHDMPWDFYRFSDSTWPGLFNARTGFEVVASDMSRFPRVVPAVLLDSRVDHENAGGFEVSQVLVRKTGPATLDWDVSLEAVIATSYPTGAAAAPPTGG